MAQTPQEITAAAPIFVAMSIISCEPNRAADIPAKRAQQR
jgi:hypothetical protein